MHRSKMTINLSVLGILQLTDYWAIIYGEGLNVVI